MYMYTYTYKMHKIFRFYAYQNENLIHVLLKLSRTQGIKTYDV